MRIKYKPDYACGHNETTNVSVWVVGSIRQRPAGFIGIWFESRWRL